MVEAFADRIHAAYGWRDTHRNFAWGMLLFADPEARRDDAAYASQPLLQVFGRGTLDLVCIHYVAAAGFDHRSRQTIIDRIHRLIGPVQVQLEPVAQVPREPSGKFRAVLCRVENVPSVSR